MALTEQEKKWKKTPRGTCRNTGTNWFPEDWKIENATKYKRFILYFIPNLMVRITTIYLSRIRSEHAITSPILSNWNEFLSTDFIARMRRRRGEWCIWHIISTHKHALLKILKFVCIGRKKNKNSKNILFYVFQFSVSFFFKSMIWFILLINIWQLFDESEYLVFK